MRFQINELIGFGVSHSPKVRRDSPKIRRHAGRFSDERPKITCVLGRIGRSVARCPRPHLRMLVRRNSISRTQLLTQQEQLVEQHSCLQLCLNDPVTPESSRAKQTAFNARRSYFAPSKEPTRVELALWWRRRVPPPGPQHLLPAWFIAIERGSPLNISVFTAHAIGY